MMLPMRVAPVVSFMGSAFDIRLICPEIERAAQHCQPGVRMVDAGDHSRLG